MRKTMVLRFDATLILYYLCIISYYMESRKKTYCVDMITCDKKECFDEHYKERMRTISTFQ